MIGIKKSGEYLDLQPGTRIQRERSSPIFLEQTESGKDAIPGEVSYPFTLPLSDKNLRLLGWPDQLPVNKELQHDVILEDAGMQLSQGKLVINSVTAHLNKSNVGNIDCHILSNISEFWQRVKDKKLSDLQLGGERSFAWAGYSLTTPGFWKHAHDTWAYNDSDDGDYVFSPIWVGNYKGENEVTWINAWEVHSGQIQLAREKNYLSLCPHVYVSYIIKQIFLEHGYAISGDILDDPDFKQICFESYRSVNWAIPQLNGPLINPVVTITPQNPVKIRVAEHVPPVMTVGELLVELQKLLPISFLINDKSKSCRIIWLTELSGSGSTDRTDKFSPQISLSFEKSSIGPKIIGFDRARDEFSVEVLESEYKFMGSVNSLTALPTAGPTYQQQMYYIRYLNAYYVCNNFAETGGSSTFYEWQRKGDNVGGYAPPDVTDTYSTSIEVSIIRESAIIINYFGAGNHLIGYFPATNRLGNWFASGNSRDFEPWPARMFFYRGSQPFSAGGNKPLVTNSIYNFNSSWPMTSSHATVGNWSLSYKVGTGNFGLIDRFWSKWLPSLQINELIKGRLYLKFHEYLQWDWNSVLLLRNTPYLVKKITEVLPYEGYVDIEAQRVQ